MATSLLLTLIGSTGLLLLIPIVYLGITRKYDKKYPFHMNIIPLKLPIISTIARGSIYTICIIFNPKSKVNQRVLDITHSVNFSQARNPIEITISMLHFIFTIILLFGVFWPF